MNSAAAHTRPKLVLASRNRKKCGEMAVLLAPYGFEVVSVADFANVPEVVEDGETFAANAAKKACQTAAFLREWTLGEDSGLCVDALGGAPGVYSARYSGPGATDETNNRRLVQELEDVPDERRGAGYVCHVTLADPQGHGQLDVEAGCRGRIVREARGTNGFGYDPHFLIPEYGRTFGELAPIVKQQISHRARAFQRLVPGLLKIFAGS